LDRRGEEWEINQKKARPQTNFMREERKIDAKQGQNMALIAPCGTEGEKLTAKAVH